MKRLITAFCISILSIVAVISLALGIIHSTNFIYKIDIRYLEIPENTELSEEVIESNVEAVLDYLSPFSDEEFDLPDLAFSPEGASHFKDCKVIFTAVYILGAVSLVLLVVLLLKFGKDKLILRLTSLFVIALPTFVGASVAVDFDKTFEIFHLLFFDDMNWIFDPMKDPIIELLPAEFFLHCAVFMVVSLLISATVYFLCSFRRNMRCSDDEI